MHNRRPSTEHVPVAPGAEFQLRTTDDVDNVINGWCVRIETGCRWSYSQPPWSHDSFESFRRSHNFAFQHESFFTLRWTRVRFHSENISWDGLCRCGRPSVDRFLRSGSSSGDISPEESIESTATASYPAEKHPIDGQLSWNSWRVIQ
jgi:hypothetical protein